jgi:hypothetical protein
MDNQGQLVYIRAFNKSQLLLSRVFGLEPESTIQASASTLVEGSPNNDDKVTRDTLPNTFIRMVECTPILDRGQATYGICHGMMTLANSHPTYIDAFLTTYFEAIALSPSQLLNSSDHTLAFQLVMNMTETANTGYRTNNWCKQPGVFRPGNDDPVNASNVFFERGDVQEHLDQVMRIALQQAREGNDYIVRAAMYARFAFLMKVKKPQWFEGFEVYDYGIEVQLRKEVGLGGWIKENLIAALIRLRGYAKSLSDKFSMAEETKGKMEEWQGLLKRWIYDPELDKTRDLMVKYHVIVSQR